MASPPAATTARAARRAAAPGSCRRSSGGRRAAAAGSAAPARPRVPGTRSSSRPGRGRRRRRGPPSDGAGEDPDVEGEDAWSTYQTSRASRSSHPGRVAPVHLGPAGDARAHLQAAGLFVAVAVEVAHRQRPRPDEAISPRTTCTSVGSSSRLVDRRNRPSRVRRSASCCGPASSGRAGRIVRNLTSLNGRPPRPLPRLAEEDGRAVDDPHDDGDRHQQRRRDDEQRGRRRRHRSPASPRPSPTASASRRRARRARPTATWSASAIVSRLAALRATTTAKTACSADQRGGLDDTGASAFSGQGGATSTGRRRAVRAWRTRQRALGRRRARPVPPPSPARRRVRRRAPS